MNGGVFLHVGSPSLRNISWLDQLSARKPKDLVPHCVLSVVFVSPASIPPSFCNLFHSQVIYLEVGSPLAEAGAPSLVPGVASGWTQTLRWPVQYNPGTFARKRREKQSSFSAGLLFLRDGGF